MTGRMLTKGRTGRDDDPERLLSLDLNLVDEFVLLDDSSPNGGSTAGQRNGVSLVTLALPAMLSRLDSHQQGQSGNDRHDGGDGKSQSVGDNTKDQSQESGSASDLDEREYEAISLGARIQPYQQAGQRLTTMRTDPTLDKLPLKLSLRNLSASSGMMSLVLVASDDVSTKVFLPRSQIPLDIDLLNEEFHRRITQDGLQRLELDGEPGRVTDSTLLGVSTRVEDTPSVFLTKTGVLSQGSGAVGHVETVRSGFHGVLKTGTVGGNIELDHVDGFRKLWYEETIEVSGARVTR